MDFIYSDGGRSNYYKANNVGDCVCRAICNATGMDYKEVYDEINRLAKAEKTREKRTGSGKSSSRNGVYKKTFHTYLTQKLGWKWTPTMKIGSGCKTHLRKEDLPEGVLIVSVTKHMTCVKDGAIYDTYDCSRDGTRCVYGYYTKK